MNIAQNNNSASNLAKIQQVAISNQKLKDEKVEGEITEPREIWFCELFRFATKFDYILMIMGSIAAIAMGVAMPAFAYIWGSMTDSFTTIDNMVEKSKQTMFTFIYVGIGAFFAGWLMFACWMITGQRQAISCRKAYLRSLLRQQIGWFDVINQTELSSKFATDTFAFQGAIGEKISTIIMTISTLIAGFIFAFITGWLMTLVVLATIPALGIAGYFYMKVIGEKDKKQQKSYAAAGGRAEQAISSIKTVKQLNGQSFQCVQYQKCLENASKQSLKYALFSGLGIAGIFFVMLSSYALGFWYGSKCILGTQNCPQNVSKQDYSAGDVLVVFFSVVMGGFNISQLTPAFKKISQGRQAAARIFQVIDRQPLIKNPPNGLKIQNLQGVIRFENVTFAYPKDRQRKVFDNLTLEFDINKTGLVGESGCGKSTTIQLIMRFYDPDQGKVTLDGHDLRTLDLIWLRQQIGYVGQEPVLFATSIKENLLFGNDKATDKEIEEALRMAEAYDFVQSLEDKLDTYVGYGGGQLSGGQKQRIAIARAILRKPKIMLLDEATSALDRRNERLIQATLEKVTQGMTTITVAHRVKTIMNSDMIYVFSKGGIAEKGKFNQLSMFKNYVQEQEQEKQNVEEINEEQKMQTLKLKRKQSSKKGDIQKEEEQIFMTKEEKQKNYQTQLTKKYDKHIFRRLFAYGNDRIPVFILGALCAMANGVIFPIFSIFLSKMLASLLIIDINPNNETQISNINTYALIFFLLGIAAFILSTIQITSFNYVGENITRKIRIQTFLKILKMPIPWFDIPRNNAGTLTARLSTDCQLVNTVTTTTVSIMIQNISTLVSGIIIAFVYEWHTSLVALGLLPLMIICGAIQMAFSTGFSDKTDAAYKDSSNLIMEAMINIRTVSSFGYEGIVAKRYDQKMQEPYRLAIKKGNASGFFFGLSQIIMFTIFGVLFYLGAVFVRDNPDTVTVEKMFVAIYAIMFAGMTAGNNAHFMPDTAACKNSAANLFEIQDSQDEDQMQIQQKSQLLKEGAEGDILLEDVDFKYQSRNEFVFKHMDLRIKKGNKVAFVGTSGCGKSTIIQLLQRFYFPAKGRISINNIDIKDFDIHYLRSCFGVVSQEPVLFNGSFADNIRYNKLEATMPEIQQAAQKANATTFILGQEQTNHQSKDDGKSGFDKNVGVKGSHISGGQKQRVAIARTILRNPKMLLLDEATSALDRANEMKVQDSLDLMMHGRTVISVAHRIQTIKNSDEIFMFEKGKIIESGSYPQLIAKQGHFYNLERGTSFT